MSDHRDPILEVEGATLEYRPFVDGVPTLRKAISKRHRRQRRSVVALDDVTFSVEKGASMAVIGANGAGKSTLLRVLAGTLVPDSGTVTVNGQTSALLQLGAGFNTELSGRMNIMLEALASGLSRAQVRDRIQWIVDYSELGSAIDRPVRTYSSGMFARLAFSIAMSLEPDILLIDEVLAVGDESFQRKSEATMNRLLEGDGTLVLVTHSMDKAKELCREALWMEGGRIRASGPTGEVVERYLASVNSS